MARFTRASLLLTAFGVATLMLPATTAAANGGAAPSATPTSAETSTAANGGASVGTATGAGTVSTSETAGGARPGARPARHRHPRRKVSGKQAGGAVPRHKPARKRARHRRRPKPAAPTPPTPPTPAAVSTVPGVFPLMGPYSFGGEDARFGAERPGHIHQGQDVIAASGTPILAPVAGTVLWKANQEDGAGIYLVVHGNDERDYVCMHIKRGTVLVEVGQAVTAGQQLAQVGSTGTSTGPHLHFEIWVGGWYAKGGAPVDPLPQLQRWAGGSAGAGG